MKKQIISIQAGHFKAKCLQLMDEVYENHISIIVTKHGKAVAKLVPINDVPIDVFGCLKGTVRFKKDIIKPIDVKWKVNQ